MVPPKPTPTPSRWPPSPQGPRSSPTRDRTLVQVLTTLGTPSSPPMPHRSCRPAGDCANRSPSLPDRSRRSPHSSSKPPLRDRPCSRRQVTLARRTATPSPDRRPSRWITRRQTLGSPRSEGPRSSVPGTKWRGTSVRATRASLARTSTGAWLLVAEDCRATNPDRATSLRFFPGRSLSLVAPCVVRYPTSRPTPGFRWSSTSVVPGQRALARAWPRRWWLALSPTRTMAVPRPPVSSPLLFTRCPARVCTGPHSTTSRAVTTT